MQLQRNGDSYANQAKQYERVANAFMNDLPHEIGRYKVESWRGSYITSLYKDHVLILESHYDGLLVVNEKNPVVCLILECYDKPCVKGFINW